MPGLVAETGTPTEFEDSPLLVTTIAASTPAVENGACRLICVGETKNSGAGTPLTVTETPASCVGKGTFWADSVWEARLEPKTDTRVPGAIGAVVTFAGVVRDNNLGRQVGYLEYEAYPEMAETKMQQVVDEARERWPAIRGVAVVHRTGHLEIGEMAVLVAVGAPHRGDGAFEAARYIIDRTKEIVPIWKKESWADGEEWLEGDYHPRSGE